MPESINLNLGENLSQSEETPEVKEKGELTFRDVREEDFDEMLRIRNEAVVAGAPLGNREVKTKEEYFSGLKEDMEKSKIGEAICVVAEKDGRFAGWVAGRVIKDADVPTAMIGMIALDKGTKGLRNFRELGEEWVRRAREKWGVRILHTQTSVENRAKNLYKRYGFKETGIVQSEKKVGDYVTLEKILE